MKNPATLDITVLHEEPSHPGYRSRYVTNNTIALHHCDSVIVIFVVVFCSQQQQLSDDWGPDYLIDMMASNNALFHHKAKARLDLDCQPFSCARARRDTMLPLILYG